MSSDPSDVMDQRSGIPSGDSLVGPLLLVSALVVTGLGLLIQLVQGGGAPGGDGAAFAVIGFVVGFLAIGVTAADDESDLWTRSAALVVVGPSIAVLGTKLDLSITGYGGGSETEATVPPILGTVGVGGGTLALVRLLGTVAFLVGSVQVLRAWRS